MLEKITADNFNKFVEMRKLIESGDRDGARAIADELGLEGQGRGIVKGVHKGNFVR